MAHDLFFLETTLYCINSCPPQRPYINFVATHIIRFPANDGSEIEYTRDAVGFSYNAFCKFPVVQPFLLPVIRFLQSIVNIESVYVKAITPHFVAPLSVRKK